MSVPNHNNPNMNKKKNALCDKDYQVHPNWPQLCNMPATRGQKTQFP